MEEVVESSGSGSEASRRADVPVISVVLSHLGGNYTSTNSTADSQNQDKKCLSIRNSTVVIHPVMGGHD